MDAFANTSEYNSPVQFRQKVVPEILIQKVYIWYTVKWNKC